MHYFLSFLWFVLILFFQFSFLSRFNIDGILLATVYSAFCYGARAGMFWGFWFGLAQDIFLGIFPFAVVSKALAGGLAGHYYKSVSGNRALVFLLLAAIAAVCATVIEAVLFYFYYNA
jgi:rod shape-determining protein MreD